MRFFNTRTLGIIGIIGAPWMFIDFMDNGLYERFIASSVSGIRNFIFMTGWVCSVVGLYKLGAMGDRRWQKMIGIVQILFLICADAWCIMEMVAPKSPSTIYYAFNFLWPIGGCFMIVTGLVILRANKLKGWKRFIPLFAGMWFPQTLCIYYFAHNSLPSLIIAGIYATIIFSLLGFIVATAASPYTKKIMPHRS